MSSQYPWTEAACLASGVVLTTAAVWLAPQPWYASSTQPLAVVLAGAWTLWQVQHWAHRLTIYRAWHQSTLYAVQPSALPPVTQGWLLGRGFRWTGKHTEALHQIIRTEGGLPVATDARGGFPALQAVGQAEEQPLILPLTELSGQVGLKGTTRSGKTMLLRVLSEQAIAAHDGPVIHLDPKGSHDWLKTVALAAVRHGRPFVLIAPAWAAQSATMSVLSTADTPAEISTRIQALMPTDARGSSDPFYTEFPLTLVERIAYAMQEVGIPWTLESVAQYTRIRTHLGRLLARYLEVLGVFCPGAVTARIVEYRKLGLEDLTADELIQYYEWPHDHFQKVTSNLIPCFRGIIGPPFGHLFSTLTPDVTWDTIVDGKMVVYLALSSLMLKQVANRIGRIVLQDLIGYLGRRYTYTHPSTWTPITCFVDEASEVFYPQFIDGVNKGGEAGARFVIAQQSDADAIAAMGEAHARRLEDNLNTKIYCRLGDTRTALEALGDLTCTVGLPQRDVGTHYGGVGGLSGSVRQSEHLQSTPTLDPAWLTGLPRGGAYARIQGQLYKFAIPYLPPTTPTTALTITTPRGVQVFRPEEVLPVRLPPGPLTPGKE